MSDYTTAVPTESLATFIINAAREYGEYGDVYDTAHEGKHGEHEFETDWSLGDLDADDVDVEVTTDNDGYTVVLVIGEVDAEYSVKTASARYNPPGKAHPAEYERREMPLGVTIAWRPERHFTTDGVIIHAEGM